MGSQIHVSSAILLTISECQKGHTITRDIVPSKTRTLPRCRHPGYTCLSVKVCPDHASPTSRPAAPCESSSAPTVSPASGVCRSLATPDVSQLYMTMHRWSRLRCLWPRSSLSAPKASSPEAPEALQRCAVPQNIPCQTARCRAVPPPNIRNQTVPLYSARVTPAGHC